MKVKSLLVIVFLLAFVSEKSEGFFMKGLSEAGRKLTQEAKRKFTQEASKLVDSNIRKIKEEIEKKTSDIKQEEVSQVREVTNNLRLSLEKALETAQKGLKDTAARTVDKLQENASNLAKRVTNVPDKISIQQAIEKSSEDAQNVAGGNVLADVLKDFLGEQSKQSTTSLLRLRELPIEQKNNDESEEITTAQQD